MISLRFRVLLINSTRQRGFEKSKIEVDGNRRYLRVRSYTPRSTHTASYDHMDAC
jgi:hypothetical protein